MAQAESDPGDLYRIRLKGVLLYPTTDWFGDVTIIPQEKNVTLLVGRFSDQPAVRGFLNQLWDLNFTVLSMEQAEDESAAVPPEKEGKQ
jgi:hypothetical protein